MELTYDSFTFNNQSFVIARDATGICFIESPDAYTEELREFIPTATLTAGTIDEKQQLIDYLNGQRTHFDLPLSFETGTDFQRTVWRALQTVPYGQTITYLKLAEKIGKPTAVRAVASAVGKNPLLMIIPCHRVLRTDGSLGGFRSGLPLKRQLLAIEQNS